MSDYKRFVSYLYEYISDKKANNRGFVKVELRSGSCRLQFQLNVRSIPENTPITIYGYIYKDGDLNGYPLGKLNAGKDGTGGILSVPARIPATSYNVMDFNGLILTEPGGKFYGSQWDDNPITPGKFQPVKTTASKKTNHLNSQQFDENSGSAGQLPGNAPSIRPATGSTPQTPPTESTGATGATGPTGPTGATEPIRVAEPIRATGPTGPTGSTGAAGQTQPSRPLQPTRPANSDGTDFGYRGTPRSQYQQTGHTYPSHPAWQIQPTQPTRAAQTTRTAQPIQPTRAAQPTQRIQPLQPTSQVQPTQPTRTAPPVHPVKPSQHVQRAQPAQPVQPTQTAQPVQPTQTAQPVQPTQTAQPVQPTQTAQPVQPAQTAQPVQPTQTAQPVQPTQTAQPVQPTQTAQPVQPTQTAQPVQPTWTVQPVQPTRPVQPIGIDPNNVSPDNQDVSPGERVRNLPPDWSGQIPDQPAEDPEAPEAPLTQQSIKTADVRHKHNEDNWTDVKRKYSPLTPFNDDEIDECVSITIRDFSDLRRFGIPIGCNQFIHRGFQRYNHLLLGHSNTRNGQYYLGVPGIYNANEQFMASMYGFNNFKPGRIKENSQNSRTGYWYRPIK